MDADVLAAIAKWPDVPAVYGWLGLTARGEWRLKGQPIENAAIRAFIGRNYAGDTQGCWYFQNGPQRVYVALEATPWVWRVDAQGSVSSHAGAAPKRINGAALLDDGRLLLQTELGAGLVDDRDAAWALRCVTDRAGTVLNEQGLNRWLDGRDEAFVAPRLLALQGEPLRIERLAFAALERRFRFVREPRAS
ncbi:MAG TPA: DUF2946 family protein [Burkholderiaceae bacterium]|jgi:hypothetical protein|nr:DUF2946 family protein [Burkholderiaceae bacterium]